MSSSEKVTRNDHGRIVGQDGLPVDWMSEEQVINRNSLVRRQQHAAYGAGIAKILDDRRLGEGHGHVSLEAKQLEGINSQLEAGVETDTAHLDANLPAYRQAASELANEALKPRIGSSIPVTKVHDGVVGAMEVTPVNPATHNHDIAPQK